jgi:hypothetical protein
MKMILAAVAFAALLTPSVFAQSPSNDGEAASAIAQQSREFRGESGNVYFHAQPQRHSESMQQELCDTAHDFCSNFYGDNG